MVSFSDTLFMVLINLATFLPFSQVLHNTMKILSLPFNMAGLSYLLFFYLVFTSLSQPPNFQRLDHGKAKLPVLSGKFQLFRFPDASAQQQRHQKDKVLSFQDQFHFFAHQHILILRDDCWLLRVLYIIYWHFRLFMVNRS